MIESKISLPLCCCDTGLSLLDIFTDLALVYALYPILIIAATATIIQVGLILIHKLIFMVKFCQPEKGERNGSSDWPTEENIKLN